MNILKVECLLGYNVYQLTEDFVWLGTTVPKGFRTNFANIPRVAWTIINPVDCRIREASVLHDYLYSIISDDNHTRLEADLILLEGMRVLGCDYFTRNLVYNVTRWFGSNYWKSSI